MDIAFNQESHLRSVDSQRFENKFYYTAASASLSSKNRGSLIVLKRNLSLNILGKYGSEDGRVSYVKTVTQVTHLPLFPSMPHLYMNRISFLN